MKSQISVLVVEDEMIIAAKISLKLSNLGYEVSGIVPRGLEAISHIKDFSPDIVLLDINLRGELDGIDIAHEILKSGRQCVVIYLTGNNDEATFNRAKVTCPFAFLTKPIKPIELQRTLELAVQQILSKREIEETNETIMDELPNESEFLTDRIFIKDKNRLVKIFLCDILYVVADRSYCEIFTKKEKYHLTTPLKNIEDKLLISQFVRVHRSYLVNIKEIDEMTENHVYINNFAIPVSPSLKADLYKRMQRI